MSTQFSDVVRVFTDASQIWRGPTVEVGVCGYLFIGEGEETVASYSGVVTPQEVWKERLESSFLEAYAVLIALEHLPDYWSGEVLTDSSEACAWFTEMLSWGDERDTRWSCQILALERAGMPRLVRMRCLAAINRADELKFTLVGGHPKEAELAAGYKTRGDGLVVPVSRHNVACDHLCRREAAQWNAQARRSVFAAVNAVERTPDPPAAAVSRSLLVWRGTPDAVWPGTPAVTSCRGPAH
jgi:hypothetical protein